MIIEQNWALVKDDDDQLNKELRAEKKGFQRDIVHSLVLWSSIVP